MPYISKTKLFDWSCLILEIQQMLEMDQPVTVAEAEKMALVLHRVRERIILERIK